MGKSVQDVLTEMADSQWGLSPQVRAWRETIEAAMREPVAENRPVTLEEMASPTYYEIRWLPGKHLPPGTKLYALPPDAAGEIERSHAAIRKANAQAEHFEREWYLRGDEIERLKQEVEAAKWVVQQYFEIAEEAVGEEVIRAKIREREAALATTNREGKG